VPLSRLQVASALGAVAAAVNRAVQAPELVAQPPQLRRLLRMTRVTMAMSSLRVLSVRVAAV